MHKGIKCLRIFTGSVYISRDIIFDENIFPFANLHFNARACLLSEIILLPALLNPSFPGQGGEITDDHVTNDSNPTTKPHVAQSESAIQHPAQEEHVGPRIFCGARQAAHWFNSTKDRIAKWDPKTKGIY
jgi:hypothetical protein